MLRKVLMLLSFAVLLGASPITAKALPIDRQAATLVAAQSPVATIHYRRYHHRHYYRPGFVVRRHYYHRPRFYAPRYRYQRYHAPRRHYYVPRHRYYRW